MLLARLSEPSLGSLGSLGSGSDGCKARREPLRERLPRFPRKRGFFSTSLSLSLSPSPPISLAFVLVLSCGDAGCRAHCAPPAQCPGCRAAQHAPQSLQSQEPGSSTEFLSESKKRAEPVHVLFSSSLSLALRLSFSLCERVLRGPAAPRRRARSGAEGLSLVLLSPRLLSS